ncbi:MAG: hypothetical protein GY722_18340 [bacterium]|nr:hypothetical protein [bacterium]
MGEGRTTSTMATNPEPLAGWHSLAVDIGVEGKPLGTWYSESGFVVAAAVASESVRRLALWRSDDGLNWERDQQLGPEIESDARVDVGPSGAVAVVAGDYGSQELGLLIDGSWTSHQPDGDWGPPHWEGLDGFEYVSTGFDFGDIELGPQGMLVAVTRRSQVDYQRAVRDAFPELTGPFEELWVDVEHDSAQVALTGIRDLPETECSWCGPCVMWDVAGEDLGVYALEEIGVDPVLALEVRNHSHARWIWQSGDLKSWTIDQMIGNGLPEHNAVGPFLDTGSAYVASIGGDFARSDDGVDWSYWDRRSDDRYFSVSSLAWSGSEVVVGASAHNAIGSAQDSYDIWAGTFDDLLPVVVAPADSLFARAYPGVRFTLAAGPVGTVVVGTNEDSQPQESTVWILRDEERIRHDVGPVTAASVGADRVVVVGRAEASLEDSECRSTLPIETYVVGE